MLNLSSISKGKLSTKPFKWGVMNGVFENNKIARSLASDFPTEGFSYRLYGKGFYLKRVLVKLGRKSASNKRTLAKSYVQLGKELGSAKFRRSVEKFTGVPLKNHPMEAVLFRTGHFTTFSAHEDIKAAAVRVTFYLNDKWSARNGGEFHILKSQKSKSPAGNLVPKLGSAAVIVRSKNSWHTVSPVKASMRDSRNTLVVTFYKPSTKSTRK
ncbi:MAG: 2OG-Fe(II) oxygenase [Bacteroidota bacterium]